MRTTPSTSPRVADGAPAAPPPPFPSAIVEEALKLFVKAVRAHQLYLKNNPTYLRALELARAAFEPVWQQTEEITLAISETDFRWEGVVVLEEPVKSPDSLPWLFYKDGVREVRLQQGFEGEELVALLDLIQRVRKASPDEDDLLSMLWEKDFAFLRYRYMDLALESAPTLEIEAGEEMESATETRPISEALEAPRAGVVSLDDFDATLYFLDEREIEYLRGEVRAEYESDLRRSILAMLFDVYEQQVDANVREELGGIIDSLMLHLLSAGQFRSVAYLLHEAAVTAVRSRTLTPVQKEKLSRLPDRLSAPDALGQLLQAMDEGSELPSQAELTELFEQLRPAALGTVFGSIQRLQNAQLRGLLEHAAARLASTNTAELVKLVASPENDVALEAIRRAGGLKTGAAVAPLSKVLAERTPPLRLAAVQALAEIASPTALQALERAVDDPDRDVRVATARAIAARGYRPSLPRIEGLIKGRAIRQADLTEKMAFFETYGALCGDAGTKLLDDILNGKGFLGRREDTEIRACAAMALGRIGTEGAMESLRRAANEKEVLVRNAVNRSLRGTPA